MEVCRRTWGASKDYENVVAAGQETPWSLQDRQSDRWAKVWKADGHREDHLG